MKILERKTDIGKEFQNAPIHDLRLINRLVLTATMLEKEPEKPIPEACGNWANTKAAYNLFAHQKITPEVILASPRIQTIGRMKSYKTVLVIQDTTKLDYTTHPNTQGLGPYTTVENAKGLLMHSALAVTTDGIPLGLLNQEIWARDPLEKGKRNNRRKLPFEEKESYKWVKALRNSLENLPTEIMPVTICDREADIFEFLKEASQTDHHILIRAVQNRRVTQEHKLLRAQIENTPTAGNYKIEVPRHPARNNTPRQAELAIKFCPMTILPAHTKNQQNGIQLYVVLAQEIEPPQGEEPIEWLLLTTLPVTNIDEAIEKINWYRQRWKIERFHYILKSGCKIEQLQLETSERLKNAIALYSVVAWRLLWLTYQARVTPEAPCSDIFAINEWQTLYCIANQSKIPPAIPPTLNEAISFIAKLGGFLGRKSDGYPGVKVLWRGLQKFHEFLAFFQFVAPVPFPSTDAGNV